MSDQRLRELERRRGGTVDDEAAWLVERIRTGSLTRERLELAAWCGLPAALALGGSPGPAGPEAWIRGLEAWSAGLATWALAEALALEPAPSDVSRGRVERLCASLRAAFPVGGEVELAERETTDRSGAEAVVVDSLLSALEGVARDPRRADPGDPDVARALASVQPRFRFLDPGEWRYGWSERVRPGRRGPHRPGWEHHLLYVRSAHALASDHVLPAVDGWRPTPDAPRGHPVLLRVTFDAVRWPPAIVREVAIAWALR